MKLIVVVATSKDGYIAVDSTSKPDSWTSEEDKALFKRLLRNHKLQVFGKNTYLTYKPKPSPEIMRAVLTRNPKEFYSQIVPGQLEFASLTPAQFVKKYESGYESCLILGGSSVYSQFLSAGLVDEIYLTIEPIELKSGIPFIADNNKLEDFIGSIQPEVTKLNNAGTILNYYKL